MAQIRQLAAIMFTDIVGYTALMGYDEQKAFNLLKKNREIQKPIIEQYHGRWIKELGDGVMASFNNVSDAVHAAIRIREKCNATEEFQLRIGIHQGDVVFEGDDIFGDAVNIASRIQAIANPGSIYISESVHHNVSNKQHITTQFVKQEILKNVKEPVKIYEIISYITTETSFTVVKDKPKKAPEKSIAVLPFINISNDPDQDYFSDGMSEEILNSLAKLKELKIASRTSSFSFKGKNVSLQEIGEKLKVHTVLEGSVRKQGNRLRITAQLINVDDGFHLWSEKYDRNMDDVFAIQEEIAIAITQQLKLTLLAEQRDLITQSPTHSTKAYELYLKGIFYVNRRGSSVLTGLKFLEQAIEVDPGYALAHNGYADAMIIAAFYGFFAGKDVAERVRQASETAMKLNDSLAEIYCTRAQYYTTMEWNWPEAKKNYLISMELNPSYGQAFAYYGLSCLNTIEGKFEEGEKYGRQAIQLEPLSAIYHADLAWTLYNAHHFKEAIEIAGLGIELDNNSFLSHTIVGWSYMAMNRHEEASETFKKLIQISNRHQYAIHYMIWASCKAGNFEDAQKLMEELELRSKSGFIARTYMGLSSGWLNDIEKAFIDLEKGRLDRDSIIITLKHAPHVPDKLRQDPRFQDLLDRIGFPN